MPLNEKALDRYLKSDDPYTYAEYPLYAPNTDIPVGILNCRIHARGDNRTLWGVEFLSTWREKTGEWREAWRTASPDFAKAILTHIKYNDETAWSDILAASGREAA